MMQQLKKLPPIRSVNGLCSDTGGGRPPTTAAASRRGGCSTQTAEQRVRVMQRVMQRVQAMAHPFCSGQHH